MKTPSMYYHRRRKLLIELLGGKCSKCGTKENLEFDHIKKSDKSFNISDRLTDSLPKVLKEIGKCQLLCNSCHKEKNKKDNGVAKHGHITMYTHHKCRCRACMDDYNIRRKKWRATARAKGKRW